ncbi:MAG: S41 family peptidase [Victivallaceae bacterium]|nr:S41 family peptidase [Victivallaceae bacterium]
MKPVFKTALLIVCIVGGCLSGRAGQTNRAGEVLDEVWNEVGKRHFTDNFKEKYRPLYLKFRPAILKAGTDTEITFEINKLLLALGQSHIALLPPANTVFSRAMSVIRRNTGPVKEQRTHNKNAFSPDQPADTGIYLGQSAGRICVIRIRKDSPADLAGIKMGDVILSIDEIRLRPEMKLYLSWGILARALLSGRAGSKVKVEYLDGADKKRSVILTRRLNGEKWFRFGVLPRSYSDFYAAVLPGNIGYVQFTEFSTPMLLRFRETISGRLRNIRGLILDMRGNIGGMLMYPPWLAAWCCPDPVNFGNLVIRDTPLELKSFPQAQCFKGPLAVLIDRDSYSCAEVFAAGMQDAGKAKLFGSVTSGKCLPSLFLKLPSGFRLQTVTGNLIRANGRDIENIGVKPDDKLVLSLESLRKGCDNVVEAARRYLLSQAGQTD